MIKYESSVINAKIRALKSELYEGDKINRLLNLRSAEEVAVNIFPEIMISDVGIDIHKDFEMKLFTNALGIFKKLGKYARDLSPFFHALMLKFEIINLKKIVKAILYPRFKSELRFLDISPYSSFDPKKALELKSLEELSLVLKKSVYKGACKLEDLNTQDKAFLIENSLDKLYYSKLFDYAKDIGAKQGKILEGFLREYSLWINLIWILRLKRFFNLKIDEIRDYIISFPGKKLFREEDYDDMFDAKYEDEILAAMPAGMKKKIEEVYKSAFDKEIVYEEADYLKVSVCIRKILKSICIKHITSYPSSIGVIPAFFELKLIEINNLNTIIEGFRLNLPKEDIKLLLI